MKAGHIEWDTLYLPTPFPRPGPGDGMGTEFNRVGPNQIVELHRNQSINGTLIPSIFSRE